MIDPRQVALLDLVDSFAKESLKDHLIPFEQVKLGSALGYGRKI